MQVGHGCGEVELDSDGGAEARRPKVPSSQMFPTAAEVEQHNVTHWPFRNWCPHCIRGQGATPNRRQAEGERQVVLMVVDNCFLNGSAGEEFLVTQVTRDVDSRYLFAHAVTMKGLTHIHGVEEMVKDLEGGQRALTAKFAARRCERTMLKNSPVGESQSNGIAEIAVQAVGEHV